MSALYPLLSHPSFPLASTEYFPDNLMNEFIAEIGDPSNPCSTYSLIKHAFEKYSDKVICNSLLKLGYNERKEDRTLEFKTSCVITGSVLTVILLGQEAALKFNRRLNISHTMSHAIRLDGIDHYTFNLSNLFNGIVIKQINDEIHYDNFPKETQFTWVKTKFNSINNDFIQKIQPQIEQIQNDKKNITTDDKIYSLKKLLLNIDYNAPVFELLKKEFVTNENQISDNESFLYAICIKDCGIEKDIGSQHFILIEQFLFNGEIRYRLYDSCIDQATLLESFKIRQYGENAEGTWNKDELNKFLNDFQDCYVPNISQDERQNRMRECFGFEMARIPLCSLYKGTFSGLSLRYYAQKFDKTKVYENLANILSPNEYHVCRDKKDVSDCKAKSRHSKSSTCFA